MLYRRNQSNLDLKNFYAGRPAFLICSGPSLNQCDLTRLSHRGILTMAVNNAAAVYRPQLWTSVDDPGNFVDAIWRDPAITKFVPLEHFDKPLVERDAKGVLKESRQIVADMPAIVGFRRNEEFVAERWLEEETFNWGNHGKIVDSLGNKGSRSVMYVALKLLFFLGFRRVFLLGCDFRMEHGKQNYVFEQDRSASSVRGNNSSYRILNTRLAQLKPYFENVGFEVDNCTPNSGLTVFPYLSFDDAVKIATASIPSRILTTGMYDRKARERIAEKIKPKHDSVSGERIEQVVSPRAPSTSPLPLKLEIVSHCWRYAPFLAYQLSSLVCYPPKNVAVTMTVFFCKEDEATEKVIEFFGNQKVTNIKWNWRPMEQPQLLRRAIGRNLAALTTSADWIWFCDCDQIFGQDCLDNLAMQLSGTAANLLYPEYVMTSISRNLCDETVLAASGPPKIVCVDPTNFRPKQFNRAVGGLQIVRGDVARQRGYCNKISKLMQPAQRWMRTIEDVKFRQLLGTRGQPIRVPNLFRI